MLFLQSSRPILPFQEILGKGKGHDIKILNLSKFNVFISYTYIRILSDNRVAEVSFASPYDMGGKSRSM